MRPGPRPRIEPDVAETLREAILACRCVRIGYCRSRGREQVDWVLHPYGMLYGNRHYLVAWAPWGDHFRIVQLAGISSVEVLDDYFDRQVDFDLGAFAAQSFGVFREPPWDVVWCFAPEVA